MSRLWLPLFENGEAVVLGEGQRHDDHDNMHAEPCNAGVLLNQDESEGEAGVNQAHCEQRDALGDAEQYGQAKDNQRGAENCVEKVEAPTWDQRFIAELFVEGSRHAVVVAQCIHFASGCFGQAICVGRTVNQDVLVVAGSAGVFFDAGLYGAETEPDAKGEHAEREPEIAGAFIFGSHKLCLDYLLKAHLSGGLSIFMQKATFLSIE